jgi:hypothetical protein
MKASHKERVALVGFQEIPLLPGQFIFGRKKAAAETGLSEKSVRTCLDCLKSLENVTIKTASKYSVLTVVNWDFYQERQSEGASKTTSKGPAKGQQRATDKNVKNVKHEKKKDIDLLTPVPPVTPPCPHQDIVSLYHATLPGLPRIQKWSDRRKRLLQARWREDRDRQSLEWWKGYFGRVKESGFLRGENDRGFRADLEWLLVEKNMIKTIEGKYDNRKVQNEQECLF